MTVNKNIVIPIDVNNPFSGELTRHNLQAQFDTIWDALDAYAENCYTRDEHGEIDEEYRSEWDDICTVMAWWREELIGD